MNALSRRLLVLFAVAWLCVPALIRAQTATPVAQLDEFLARANIFESQRQWQRAADLYERAVRLFPERNDLKERWKKAERLYSLSRRYHDSSFTSDLLVLDESSALELYAEVLRKVETHYVDEVDAARIAALGYRYLDLALADPTFLGANYPGVSENTIQELRDALARRSANSKPQTYADAIAEAESASRICRLYGLKSQAAAILEFVTGATEGLDSYSTHLSPNRLRDLYAMIDGNFVGLGIEVRGETDGLMIINVLPGSPAELAGLQPGEEIIAIDGQSISGLPTEDAANRLQGKAGSPVALELRLPTGKSRFTSVVRGEVVVHSVTAAAMIDSEHMVGYIRLNSFQKRTDQELRQSVEMLLRRGMKAMVLDLRGNPGGLLDVALKVADFFINDGTLVSTQGRAWGQSWKHESKHRRMWTFPLTVIVDEDSASASEILAGAIQDHGIGLIVGSRTYGKGSVQSIFPLRTAETGLRLTTAHFFSPKGRVYQNIGVEPNVVVQRKVGPNGEVQPVPHQPSLNDDDQLRTAHRLLVERSIAEKSRPKIPAGG